MLDGKCYYAAFPDEKPDDRPRLQGLLDALEKLEKEFRQHIEQFQTAQPGGNTNPAPR